MEIKIGEKYEFDTYKELNTLLFFYNIRTSRKVMDILTEVLKSMRFSITLIKFLNFCNTSSFETVASLHNFHRYLGVVLSF